MRKGVYIFGVILFGMIFACNKIQAQDVQDVGLIPMPQELQMGGGTFEIDPFTVIYIDSSLQKETNHLVKAIEHIFDTKVKVSVNKGRYSNQNRWIKNLNTIILSLVEDEEGQSKDSYDLIISNKYVLLKGNSRRAVFYGIQTLLQLLPSKDRYFDELDSRLIIPQLQIHDYPDFTFRTFKLDCSAQYIKMNTIKKYIDLMAFYKMNYLHWKLSGNEGWRMESKLYPRLTKVAAWRLNDKGEVEGGYYSQENIKAIIEYAKSKYIDIIPEIELPSNSLSIINAYPELGIGEGPFELSQFNLGNKHSINPGKSGSYNLMFKLISETAQLFGSNIVHIGGAPVNVSSWSEDQDCSTKIKARHLANEHGLLGYFVNSTLDHISQQKCMPMVNSSMINYSITDRNVIYLEDIYQAKLPYFENQFFVYNDQKYSDLSFDVEQINLDSIYQHYLPKSFYKDYSNKIVGGVVQYKATEENRHRHEKMILPRLLPIVEHLWNYKQNRNRFSFKERYNTHHKHIIDKGYALGFDRSPFEVESFLTKKKDSIQFVVKQHFNNLDVSYSYVDDDGEYGPFAYSSIAEMSQDATVEFMASLNGQVMKKEVIDLTLHNGLAGKYQLMNDTMADISILQDGVTKHKVHPKDWYKVESRNLDVFIDLGDKKKIKRVQVDAYQDSKKNILLPEYIKVEYSTDGKSYFIAEVIDHPVSTNRSKELIYSIGKQIKKLKARYLRLNVKNMHKCPPSHPAAGMPSTIAVGEIIID